MASGAHPTRLNPVFVTGKKSIRASSPELALGRNFLRHDRDARCGFSFAGGFDRALRANMLSNTMAHTIRPSSIPTDLAAVSTVGISRRHTQKAEKLATKKIGQPTSSWNPPLRLWRLRQELSPCFILAIPTRSMNGAITPIVTPSKICPKLTRTTMSPSMYTSIKNTITVVSSQRMTPSER